MITVVRQRVTWLSLLFLPMLGGCKITGHCGGGDCVCPEGASCELECDAPPCHVECVGRNPECRAECGNGDCACGPDSHCDLTCHSPPCHVQCDESTNCSAVCANGDCTCSSGSECAFTCDAGPCHVACEGNHRRCDGQCANGTCECGPSSVCSFECLDGNCHTYCGQGSSCLLRCGEMAIGAQGCRFDQCAAGEPQLCPDGITLRCGDAVCPPG